MRKVLFVAAAIMLSVSSTTQAREFADVYAECGIGAMLFNQDGTGSENSRLLAIISNVTFDLGTTAHISNMSSPETCAAPDMTTAALILDQYPEIEAELSQGSGEHLVAMHASYQCAQPIEVVMPEVQGEFKALIESGRYDSMDQVEKSGVIYDALASSCTV